MTQQQYFKNLTPPRGMIDVVLDTDAYNEIDDQFAISYMIRRSDKFRIRGFCAAPFFNSHSTGPADGMERSYHEIRKLLTLAGREDLMDLVYRGSGEYLPSETVPVESPAADLMAELAKSYCPENPLYIVAIGAITNVASAILKNPAMKESCVVVWLGGNGIHMPRGADEFNMKQDIAASRVVFGCGVPLVQLPCGGVVDRFTTSQYELEHWLKGKNPLCDYLCENTVREAEFYAAGKPWTRVIWDVTAVAWLLNGEYGFMKDRLMASPIPEYDLQYGIDPDRHLMRYVYHIDRDALFEDLFQVLGEA